MLDYLSSGKLRDRAEECRVIARTYGDTETRKKMLHIADGYDRMAEHAERHEAGTTLPGAAQ